MAQVTATTDRKRVSRRGGATASAWTDWTARFALLALLGLAFAVGHRPLADGDLFWNLALGNWIVGHGALPTGADPFI